MAKPAKPAGKKPAARKAPVKPAAKPAKKPPPKAAAAKKPSTSKASSKKGAGASGGDKQRFTLYGSMLSGPTYAVGLMLSLARHPFSYIHVNLREGQHKQPDYLVKNRYGQVPTLRDGQTFFVQSAAILDHLANQLTRFEGKTVAERQRILEWMFWNWDKLAAPIFRLRQRARGLRQFGDEVRAMYDADAKAALAALEQELTKSDWVAGKRPTIADISVYAVLRYAAEANIDLSPYTHLSAWKKRLESLPGFGTPEQILPLESRLL